MKEFINKYNKYENFNEFFSRCKDFRINKTFIYNNNDIINNNSYIEKMKEKFKDIIIELDSITNTDNNIIIFIFNLNNCYTSTIFIIDIEKKQSHIIDLRSSNIIIKTDNKYKEKICENIIKYIIKIIIKISKQYKMNKIEFIDYSYHVCDNPKFFYSFDQGYSLTNGRPIYYDFGFKFTDNNYDPNVEKNLEKLTFISTYFIDIDYLIAMINTQGLEYITEEEIKKEIKEITILYNKYKYKRIMNFLIRLKYRHPKIFCLIYERIFSFLKLSCVRGNFMELILNE